MKMRSSDSWKNPRDYQTKVDSTREGELFPVDMSRISQGTGSDILFLMTTGRVIFFRSAPDLVHSSSVPMKLSRGSDKEF